MKYRNPLPQRSENPSRSGPVSVHSDSTQTCRECGQPFTLTDSERDYFHMRGLLLPKRCTSCRRARRASLRSHSTPSSSVRPPAATRQARPVTRLDEPPAPVRTIICYECHRQTEIPARCVKQSKAKCLTCWNKDIRAWLRRKASRRNAQAPPAPAASQGEGK